MIRLIKRLTLCTYRHLAVLILSSTFCSWSQAQTLLDVYQQAINNDHEYRSAQAVYKAGLEAKGLARAGLLPQISANASREYSEVDQPDQPFPQQVFESNLPLLNTQTDAETTTYGLNLSQPLFNLAAWHTYKAGKANANIAEAQFFSAQQALILRTTQAYFDVLRAVDSLKTARSEEETLKQQLEQTQQRFDVGLSAITDVHESQAAYDSALAERLIAEGQLGIAFEALEVLTGKPYGSIAPLKASFEAIPPQPANREEWVTRALDKNYGLQAARLNADAAKQTSKARRADHFPTIALTGSYVDNEQSSNTNASFAEEFVTESERKSVAVTLTIPISSGGAVSASRRQSQQLAVQAREDYLQAKRDVIQATRSQHLFVKTGVATVKARKQAVVSSESALEATEAGYRVGTRNLVDVLNAQRSVFQAKRNYFNALYDYVLSSMQLKEVSGMLAEQDVEQLSNWLDTSTLVSSELQYNDKPATE